MEKVSTSFAPAAIGPYSQAITLGSLVFTSGQIPLDPKDSTIPEGIQAQAEQCCKNVAAVLKAGGSSIDKVIKTTCYLTDMSDFAAFNAVYAKYFTGSPARSCVAVRDLPRGAWCEIEAIGELL